MKSLARRPLAYFAIPAFVLPFALVVIFEKYTDFLPEELADRLFVLGRHILPISFLYKVHHQPFALESVLSEPVDVTSTHWRDILAWTLLSIIYGAVVQKMRLRYAYLLAPFAVIAMSLLFALAAWRLGYVVWGHNFRVVG